MKTSTAFFAQPLSWVSDDLGSDTGTKDQCVSYLAPSEIQHLRTTFSTSITNFPLFFGGITSSRCTNEETFLVQKLVRAAFGNNNVDTCARVCHSPTGYGLKNTIGESAGTQNFDSVMKSDVIIGIKAVQKTYDMGEVQVHALRSVNLELYEGEFVVLLGPSGSGKSTLLNMVTGIDRPNSGRILFAGEELRKMNENSLARWRGQHVGIVFQFFQLVPTLTALENVLLALELGGGGGLKRRRDGCRRRSP